MPDRGGPSEPSQLRPAVVGALSALKGLREGRGLSLAPASPPQAASGHLLPFLLMKLGVSH